VDVGLLHESKIDKFLRNVPAIATADFTVELMQ